MNPIPFSGPYQGTGAGAVGLRAGPEPVLPVVAAPASRTKSLTEGCG